VLLDGGIAARGLFIIDDNGILQSYMVNNLAVGRSVDEVLRLVQGYQYVAKNGEVCPASWKPGAKTMKPDPVGAQEYFAAVTDAVGRGTAKVGGVEWAHESAARVLPTVPCSSLPATTPTDEQRVLQRRSAAQVQRMCAERAPPQCRQQHLRRRFDSIRSVEISSAHRSSVRGASLHIDRVSRRHAGFRSGNRAHVALTRHHGD
jgi:hypothetical protein